MSDNKPKIKRTLQGVVVSNKMDKTIVVLVVRKVKHPIYGKYIKRSKKIHAHDASNSCSMGDVVIVSGSRPMSRTKTWVLDEIVGKTKDVIEKYEDEVVDTDQPVERENINIDTPIVDQEGQ